MVAVLSGGNIDPLLLCKVIRHGMAAAGRYLDLPVPDPRPARRRWPRCCRGGRAGANVLDVVHERVTPGLHLDEVEVQLQLETRGPAHCDGVISKLRESGYRLLFS